MKVSKDSIDLGMIGNGRKSGAEFYRDGPGLEMEGALPLRGGRMYRLKIGTTFLKLLKLEKTPTASALLNDLEHGGQFALPRLKLSESI